MEVTYKIRPGVLLQNYRYLFNRSIIGKIVFLVWLLVPFAICASSLLSGINPLTSPDVGSIIGWFVGSMAPFILSPFLSNIITVSIDAHGWKTLNQSSSVTMLISWQKVKAVEEDTRYIYFRKTWQMMTIPKDAFSSSVEAEAFFETALGYWRKAKGIPSPSAPATSGVWPPAPRVGDSQELGEKPKR